MKPCPFCGETQAVPEQESEHGHLYQWSVMCHNCLAMGPACGTRVAAQAAWDERAGEEE